MELHTCRGAVGHWCGPRSVSVSPLKQQVTMDLITLAALPVMFMLFNELNQPCTLSLLPLREESGPAKREAVTADSPLLYLDDLMRTRAFSCASLLLLSAG